jgi:hypothetical protein
LFDLSYQLCKEFPALTPFEIDKTEFNKIIALFSDLRTMQIKNRKEEKIRNDPNRVIRRPAGDDWF